MAVSKVFVVAIVLGLWRGSLGCDITHECTNEEEVTWATDGTSCHVFHNRCFLDNVNCHHRNNKMPQLQSISQQKCQALCVTDCPPDDNPVCGYYKEVHHTFANQCEMEAYICQNGVPIFFYGVGPCDPDGQK